MPWMKMEVPEPWRGTRSSCIQGTDFLTRRHIIVERQSFHLASSAQALISLSESKTSPDYLHVTPGFTYGTPTAPKGRHHLFTSEGAWTPTSDMDET